jgi:hypothetical protein
MRVKLLRGDDEAVMLLVHPATLEEYAGALETRSAGRGAGLQTVAAWSPPSSSTPGGNCPTWPHPAGRRRVELARGLHRVGTGGFNCGDAARRRVEVVNGGFGRCGAPDDFSQAVLLLDELSALGDPCLRCSAEEPNRQ